MYERIWPKACALATIAVLFVAAMVLYWAALVALMNALNETKPELAVLCAPAVPTDAAAGSTPSVAAARQPAAMTAPRRRDR